MQHSWLSGKLCMPILYSANPSGFLRQPLPCKNIKQLKNYFVEAEIIYSPLKLCQYLHMY